MVFGWHAINGNLLTHFDPSCKPFLDAGEQQVMWVYTSSEDKQEWELPGRGVPEDGDEGGTLWLPGGE